MSLPSKFQTAPPAADDPGRADDDLGKAGDDYGRATATPLLTASEAKHASPAQRAEWINASRDILQHSTAAEISALPLDDRLSLAAASYGFWLQHLGNPEFDDKKNGEWERLTVLTRALPDDGKQALTADLALQEKALSALTLPTEYFRMEDRLHDRAYAAFMQNPDVSQIVKDWGRTAEENFLDPKTGLLLEGTMSGGRMSQDARSTLDAAGITHDKVLRVMNAASAAMNNAWTEEMASLGIHDTPKPIRVDDAPKSEPGLEFNVRQDAATGETFYTAGSGNTQLLDPRNALHVAFHEPQHRVQRRIAELLDGGTELPDYMRQASNVFRMIGDFGAQNCPPDVLAVNDDAHKLAHACYALSLGEELALYQGNRVTIDINRDIMPDARPKIDLSGPAARPMQDVMPQDRVEWVTAAIKAKSTPDTTAAGPSPKALT